MDEVITQEAPAPELPVAPAKPLFNDYYLKFDNEEAANAALVAAGVLAHVDAVLDENEQVIQPAGFAPANSASVDVIGAIYKPTGEMETTEMGERPVMAAVPGWHVNVRSSTEIEALKQYDVAPDTPVRVWA